ncbi:hypothetical protein P3X46_031156 [Hevea brasiliensis]|uniref:Remorin C-terminal domain-containing protein n=2 Tax=Hevea brasiliensis TaxID=3981 RepID=A0ABQ9KKK6_HEVBR|nr:remorin 1.4 isoform X2 [Hevea brasiliensis]XP_021669617.1 remorin 1.4 isoform X2 [Hevea brasiliensis]KAJ9140517.1 hypothetical protein P3X46_031156 [Hevea brasiliensis]
MSWEYDSEFAAAVAATAFAIYTLEEAGEEYRRKIRGDFGKSKTEIRTRKEDSSAGSVRVTRPSSSKEVKHAGESSIRNPAEQDHRVQGTFMPARKPSRLASTKPMASTDQRRKGTSTRSEVVESKIDSWEKAQLRKINKRYEKKKSKVFAWENEKKMEAKLHMERKKNELELRKSRNLQHYQINVERIDAIVGGARAQLEEKRRNEEAEVKEKAKYMRRKGKNPVRCFCC